MPISAAQADSAGDRSPAAHAVAGRLVVENLRRVYDGRAAVDDVSWEAEAGQTLCLLGHSGCGKTTLLRLIAGIEAPSAGRVLIDGEELSGPAFFVAPERRRIGLVFQDYALFPHLSVLDNVAFGLRAQPRDGARRLALTALQRVGMAAHANHYPHTLSGGEQQRVALARALAPQPRVLLMDEPFSNLDRRLRDRVREETMQLLREAGTTTVVVTHDPEEALRIADRIVLMRAGRIEQAGRPTALYRHPSSLFAARFFCDLNEIPGRCRNGVADTALGAFPAPGHAEGTALTVCLRPQDLRLADRDTGLPATLLDRVFLGETEQLRLRVDGCEQPLVLRLREPVPAVAGPRLYLDVRREAALVFVSESTA